MPAIDVARQTTERFPEHDIAWRQLGQALKRQGRLDEAVAAFSRAHALLRSPGSQYGMNRPEIRHTHRAKLRHDIEQLRYLKDRGVEVSGLDRLIVEHEFLQAALPANLGDGDVVGLPPADILKAGGHYNRCMHRAQAPALETGALNPDLDATAITSDYFSRGPGITWIDSFLRPEALASLRNYLLESTIWHDAEHPNGYVGAYIHDGFDCPLILQIARELPSLLPGIFGDRPLLQLWAYHYDSQLSGIGMHADFAAVNVNFWLTPDDAMLDPESGGMRIWDVEAPAEWGPEDFNTADPATKERIDAYLQSSGARGQGAGGASSPEPGGDLQLGPVPPDRRHPLPRRIRESPHQRHHALRTARAGLNPGSLSAGSACGVWLQGLHGTSTRVRVSPGRISPVDLTLTGAVQ